MGPQRTGAHVHFDVYGEVGAYASRFVGRRGSGKSEAMRLWLAQVLGWDADIGSLEAGKEADLVVLDLDHPLGLTPKRVLSDLVFAAGPQHVHAVLVHGETIYEDDRFTRIDESAVRARIRQQGRQLSRPA